MANYFIVGAHIKYTESVSEPYNVAQSLFEEAVVENWGGDGSVVTSFVVKQDEYFPRGPLLSRPKLPALGTVSINIPVVRELLIFLTSLLTSLAWCTSRRNRAIVLCFNYPPVSSAVLTAGRLTNTPVVSIFTDLPQFIYSSDRISRMPAWKRPLMKSYRRYVDWLATRYDGYVLFAKPMSSVVNPAGRPEVVVEGIYNGPTVIPDPRPLPSKIIAHAGTLDRVFGIETLLEAFSFIADPGAKLWLMGKGDMDESIRKRAQSDPRITHFGFVSRDEVMRLVSQSTLLVIVRDPEDDFTSYSFPSKLFEYLASGVCVASTDLPGVPDEYRAHLFRLEYGGPMRIGSQIEELLRLAPESRSEFGRRAQEFILREKVPAAQVPRIEKLVRGLLKESVDQGVSND